MSKYKPLSDRLAGHEADEWRASFAELEEVLGFPLPKGARAGSAWWANDGDKGLSRAWTSHGWRVGHVDKAGESVTFQRAQVSAMGVVLDPPAHAQPSVGEPASPVTDLPSQAAESSQIQPSAMKRAAEAASRRSRLTRAAPIAAGVAVVAGLATVLARAFRRRA
jgi:hypothetical protein